MEDEDVVLDNNVDNIEARIEGVEEDDEEVLSDCVLPKRPVPSFFLFCREKKDELPSMALLERTQILSQMWKAASDEEKQEYIDANKLEKQRYRNEMTALQKKHPNALKILLARKKAKKKPHKHQVLATKKDESPPKKRGRKRKRPPTPSLPSHSPPVLSPSKQSPVHVQQQRVPLPQQVLVPGTDIAIFTPEFLDYNKKLNSQLMQIRKTNNDLQSEVSRLEDSMCDQEKALNELQDKFKTFKEESQTLERNRQKLEDSIFKSFGSLANGRTNSEITSAEQLLNTLLANSVNSKALAVAVKSFIAL